MFRGTTARTVMSLLAATLLALPFFALTSSFAQAHTARHVEAKAQPGIKPSTKPARDEILTARPALVSRSSTAHSPAALQVFRR